jgi:hypothetical protein
MSRKHYIQIAAMLKGNKPADASELALWNTIVRELAYTFASDNSAFDRSRFLSACGMD